MKSIVVPKNKSIEPKLDYDTATAEDLLEFVFKSDNDFYELWERGLFNDINNACHSMISDFEDSVISSKDDLKKAFDICSKYHENDSAKEIQILIQEAINRNTKIFFYF